MSKVTTKLFQVHPWQIIQRGLDPQRSLIAESVFSVGNEFMGVRGYFEEGYGGKTTLGSYFNGIFEYHPLRKEWFKGLPARGQFIVNAVNWLFTRLTLDGEQLDLATSKFSDFQQALDLQTGIHTRSFIWQTHKGSRLRLTFQRLTSMVDANLGLQRITFEPLNFSGAIAVEAGLDFGIRHYEAEKNLWPQVQTGQEGTVLVALGRLPESGHAVCSTMRLVCDQKLNGKLIRRDKYIGRTFSLALKQGQPLHLDRIVVNTTQRDKSVSDQAIWKGGIKAAADRKDVSFDSASMAQVDWWKAFWDKVGVSIEGDPENEQGLRFCIFQLTQTYHGVDPSLNIAAKGLTSEYYRGHAWWETEPYCMPFYMFTNPPAARNLLGYRYVTLPNAIANAERDDCQGARYPLSTIDGSGCDAVWQHADLQIHVGTGVAYGIWHYVHVTGDERFLHDCGMEMLLQISRYYASRGGWGRKTGKFGFWGVMGTDEYHMMVNHNFYTNLMAQRMFRCTLQAMAQTKKSAPAKLAAIMKKVKLRPDEPREWKKMADRMYVPLDPKTGLYEQHEGFFNYPHTDLARLPADTFPLYRKWAYFRIFRNDLIKQPDVLLVQFLCSQDYSDASKRANFEYYEPHCTHDSSLSPGIHSILAAELGMHQTAEKYWRQAARLDLDDYNHNAADGLHTTSMAAAWMNLVYGFGGMRSDSDVLSFKPLLPGGWKSFSFRIQQRGSLLNVTVDRRQVTFQVSQGPALPVSAFGRRLIATAEGVSVPMPAGRLGQCSPTPRRRIAALPVGHDVPTRRRHH